MQQHTRPAKLPNCRVCRAAAANGADAIAAGGSDDELTPVARQDSLPLFTDVVEFVADDTAWLQQQAPSSQELLHQSLHRPPAPGRQRFFPSDAG